MPQVRPQWGQITASTISGWTVVALLSDEPVFFWVNAVGLTLFGVFLCALSIWLQKGLTSQ